MFDCMKTTPLLTCLMLLSGALCAQPIHDTVLMADQLVNPTLPFKHTRPESASLASQEERADQAALVVNSILIRSNLRLAVINSQRLEVGDLIDEAHVLAIEPGYVLLEQAGEVKQLELHPASLRKAVE